MANELDKDIQDRLTKLENDLDLAMHRIDQLELAVENLNRAADGL